jgi:hypothetical protein
MSPQAIAFHRVWASSARRPSHGSRCHTRSCTGLDQRTVVLDAIRFELACGQFPGDRQLTPVMPLFRIDF